jgi:hypothetical protein
MRECQTEEFTVTIRRPVDPEAAIPTPCGAGRIGLFHFFTSTAPQEASMAQLHFNLNLNLNPTVTSTV